MCNNVTRSGSGEGGEDVSSRSAGEAGRPDGATLRLHHGTRPAPHSGLVCSQQVGHIHITNMDRECFRVTLETGKVNHPHLCISPYAAIRGRMHKNKIENVALSNVLLIRYLTMISLMQGSLCQQRRFLVLRTGLGLLRAGVKIWPKNRHFFIKKKIWKIKKFGNLHSDRSYSTHFHIIKLQNLHL